MMRMGMHAKLGMWYELGLLRVPVVLVMILS